MRRMIQWLVRPKMLKRYVWALVVLATLTVLFHQVEKWRGARAWERMVVMLEEAGETVEF